MPDFGWYVFATVVLNPSRFCSRLLTLLVSALPPIFCDRVVLILSTFWDTWLMVVVFPWAVLATSVTLPVISSAFCVRALVVA